MSIPVLHDALNTGVKRCESEGGTTALAEDSAVNFFEERIMSDWNRESNQWDPVSNSTQT